MVPLAQSIWGLALSKNGYPRIRLSLAVSVIKNVWHFPFSRCLTLMWTACVMSPSLLKVPLMFRTLQGFESFLLTSWSSFTNHGWMKFSVAPLSSRASFATLWYCDDSIKRTLIDLFLAMYTVSSKHTQMRVATFRHWENPFPPLLLSWPWQIWLFLHLRIWGRMWWYPQRMWW